MRALLLASAIAVQAALGVLTLLHQAPLPLALMHQAMALVVLTIAVIHAADLPMRRAESRFASAALPS
jgi:cytochrome c oxidase assembly protein subunit 15